jgi:hypothetical protein
MEGNAPGWWPMSGRDLIPDAGTALEVGKAILERYYGDSTVRRYEPYSATLEGEEWWIRPPNASRSDKFIVRGGGFSELSIAKKDTRVLPIMASTAFITTAIPPRHSLGTLSFSRLSLLPCVLAPGSSA